MKTIHYSRTGYNGDFTYSSVCGERVKTHQDKVEISIHPEKANCKNCLASREFKADIAKPEHGIKVRIYVESDILQASEFRSAQREVDLFTTKNT